MAKKGFRFTVDAPVTLFLVLAGIIVFIINSKYEIIPNFFTCHPLRSPDGSISAADTLFNKKLPLDYIRLFTHVFGNTQAAMLLLNSMFLLLLGPQQEEHFGGFIVVLMTLLSALVSGVLAVCTNTVTATGAGSVIFMLLALAALVALAQGRLRLSWIALFILYLVYRIYELSPEGGTQGAKVADMLGYSMPVFIDLAGGICGSLVGFFITPKKIRGGRSFKAGGSVIDDDATIPAERFSAKKSKKKKASAPEDEVIGSIEF